MRARLVVVFSVMFLLLGIQSANAAQISYSDNNVIIPIYSYPGSYIKFASTIVSHDAASYSSKWANFTNLALGTVMQSFAVSVTNGNVTINKVTSTYVEFILNFNSGNPKVSLNYVMPSGLPSPPKSVVISGGSTVIQQALYFTDPSTYSSCVAPCVFQNTGNNTLILKAPNPSALTVDFYYQAYGNGQNCGFYSYISCSFFSTTTQNGGGGPIPYSSRTQTTNQPLPAFTITLPDLSAVAIPLILIAVLAFAYFNDKRKRRSVEYEPPKRNQTGQTFGRSGNSGQSVKRSGNEGRKIDRGGFNVFRFHRAGNQGKGMGRAGNTGREMSRANNSGKGVTRSGNEGKGINRSSSQGKKRKRLT